MITTATLCAVTLLAGFTQGISGFGSVLLVMPVAALLFGMPVAIPLTGIVALSLNVTLLTALRREMRGRDIAPILVGLLPGFPLGVLVLRQAEPVVLEVILATLVLCFALYSLLPGRAKPRPWGGKAGFAVGVLSGGLGGSIGANGPPVVAYLASQGLPKDRVRAAMAAYFLLTGCIITSTHVAFGLVTSQVLELFAFALPCLALGAFLGTRYCARVSEAAYRRLVTLFLLGLGMLMAGRVLLQ